MHFKMDFFKYIFFFTENNVTEEQSDLGHIVCNISYSKLQEHQQTREANEKLLNK